MALLQHHRLPGIGCSSNVLARPRSQCLAAASHAPSLPVLLHVNGSGSGQAHLLSRKATGNAVSSSGSGRRRDLCVVFAATANVTPASPRGVSASDVLWPSAGAFLAMAVLGRIDQMMAFKGVSLTIAPLGAVSAVLFTAPDSPALL